MAAVWDYNEQHGQWEATIGRWLAFARVDVPHDVYMAMLKSHDQDGQDGQDGPLHMAPKGFELLEEAQSWCEAEVRRLEGTAEELSPYS